MKRHLTQLPRSLRESYMRLEDRPLVIVLAAAVATVSVVLVLASDAGWSHVMRVVHARHSWALLAVCLVGELIAYGGYVLTVRAVARVDDGNAVGLRASIVEVIAGFGVFAATRTSGGFVADYWAFCEAGADRREAVRRVLALSFLEYAMLSVGALVASVLLFFGLDGHASEGWTLPSLIVVPVFVVALWLTSPRRAEHLSRPLPGRLRRLFGDSVAGAATARHLLTSASERGRGVLGNGLYWAGDVLCLWAALSLVDAYLSVATLVLAYSAGYVLTRRALPVGGAGFVEIALTLSLVGLGLHSAPALLGVVVYRLFNFWLPIVVALALMSTIGELRERFGRSARAL